MTQRQVTVAIGTKPLALIVGYSDITDELPPNQDPEKLVIVEGVRKFQDWDEEDLERFSRDVAQKLVSQGIYPSSVRSFVDDRYEELTQAQMDRFKDYCEQARASS